MQSRSASLAIVGILAGLLVVALPTGEARGDDELDIHLSMLRKQAEDPTLAIGIREQMAQEIASTLDRAAQAAPTAEVRRTRWTEAIKFLDEFEKQNPGHPLTYQFQCDAAVFLWARARLWGQQWELSPADLKARTRAIENLDVVISRLKAMDKGRAKEDDALSQNIRFRLAQALADRADLEPEGSDPRRELENEALGAIEKPITEPMLQGFANLLRAQLLGRLGKPSDAEAAFELAAKASPAPPDADRLETLVGIKIRRTEFDDARKAIDASKVGDSLKALLAVRVGLAQARSTVAGPERSSVEADLFQRVKPLRGSSDPEARLALIALAKGLVTPGSELGPDAWETLAEGATALGDLSRAASLESKAADRADTLDDNAQATTLRLRAGAMLFQQGSFLEADAMFSMIFDDPDAGAARVKAGILRILARSKAVAQKLPGASRASYVSALEAQIRDFPKDPTANQARWLLGKLRLDASEHDTAKALWMEIPRGDPHWLDSRLALAEIRQDDLDNQRINNDRALIKSCYDDAKAFLNTASTECKSQADRTAIDLAMVRLELTPDAGHPDEARSLCESILRSAGHADQRDRARRLHIVAVAEQSHFLEAELEARNEISRSRAPELIEAIRLVDYAATDSPWDLQMRRFGLLLRILLSRGLENEKELAPLELQEFRMRQTRAYLLSGDDERARESLSHWPTTPPPLGDRFLKELADTYGRLDAWRLAADVQRLRTQRVASGSLRWFEARYGLGLAYYRSGKEKEALKLIDGTGILYPGFGGGDLREKFVRLRQRLEPQE